MAGDEAKNDGADRRPRQTEDVDIPSGLLSPQMFRVALEHAHDAVVITTSELDLPGPQILYVNSAFTKMTGYEPVEILGQTPRILQGPKTSRRVLDRLRSDLERGRTFSGRTVNYRKDGSEFWLEWRIAPVRDAHGNIAYFIALQRDVSQAVRAESHRRQMQAELEHLVHKRTQELAASVAQNERLFERERAARLRAETAQERLRVEAAQKDEFLAMLAHELRNPLSSVVTATQLMKITPPSAQSFRRASGVLERQIAHLVRLVDDLLDTARITEGKIPLRMQKVELERVVREALEGSAELIRGRGHTLSVRVERGPVFLHGDPTRLVQALGNLLTNAARYTPQGGKIWVEAAREKGKVAIHVRDNGIGIAPNMLDKVFDLFAQADRDLARTQGGLGLGLTLARRLVELHGGTIEVKSPGIGMGSEFVIRLPEQPHVSDEASSFVTRLGDEQARGLRILLVEDNRDAREALSMLLTAQGHTVEAVEDGPRALERSRRFDPELVLLDIGLPGMSGYDVARRLREREDGQGMRLVAITGYGLEGDRARSRSAGFDAHLVKPVAPEQLAAEIARATRAHARHRRNQDHRSPGAP